MDIREPRSVEVSSFGTFIVASAACESTLIRYRSLAVLMLVVRSLGGVVRMEVLDKRSFSNKDQNLSSPLFSMEGGWSSSGREVGAGRRWERW